MKSAKNRPAESEKHKIKLVWPYLPKIFIIVSIKTSVVPRSIPSSHAILKNFKMDLGLGMELAYNTITMTAMINELQVC